MRAMILAAGRGERMGELTLTTPKPLLRVAGRYLIEYALLNLKKAGIHEVVINVSHLADKIQAALGDGSAYGMAITYSIEPTRLETGGGIYQALPLLGDAPFIVVSGDVISDFPLLSLPAEPKRLAHLVVVNNPDFHPIGDFGLVNGFLDREAPVKYTFANIGMYRPELFCEASAGAFPLNQLLFPAIARKEITGELDESAWYNVGTPSQLNAAEEALCFSHRPCR